MDRTSNEATIYRVCLQSNDGENYSFEEEEHIVQNLRNTKKEREKIEHINSESVSLLNKQILKTIENNQDAVLQRNQIKKELQEVKQEILISYQLLRKKNAAPIKIKVFSLAWRETSLTSTMRSWAFQVSKLFIVVKEEQFIQFEFITKTMLCTPSIKLPSVLTKIGDFLILRFSHSLRFHNNL